MRMPVSWHKECLVNMLASAYARRQAAERATADADRIVRQCNELDAKIIEAELRGVAAFDADKFGNRKKK